jgi:flagellar basal-body rod modification protein FlgD
MPDTTAITSSIDGARTASPGQASRSDSTGLLGQDAFLKLLVAEMQHQDPMQPTDSAQMMAQLAQFSSVEQLNKVASSITSMQSSQTFSGAVALLGKSVTYTKDDGSTATGTVGAVTANGGSPVLQVGSDSVSLANVTEVK